MTEGKGIKFPGCLTVTKFTNYRNCKKKKETYMKDSKVVKEYSAGSWKTGVWPQLARVT